MTIKKQKIKYYKNTILDVVSDALIYEKNIGDGKAIPHIIIDTEKHPEIQQAMELHKDVKSGEISFSWGMTTDKKNVLLMIDCINPVEISFIIKFDLNKQYAVVDRILSAQSLYIQPGKIGERLLYTSHHPKILVEIPHTGFEKEWKKIYRKTQKKRFKALGVKKKDLNKVIDSFNNEWENVINRHFK